MQRQSQAPSNSTSRTDCVIEACGLRKVFGDSVAVENLTLTVGRGEVFGFIGPNGAGKTTSVKMLLGLVRPTSGEGRLMGLPIGQASSRARVGFLPEHFRFPDWLTAAEFLRLHADLAHLPSHYARKCIPELLDAVGLTAHAGKQLKSFSKGMLQRIGLAQALIGDPVLVILDEPTSGLDPVGRLLVRDIIRGLRTRGVSVLLNSHLLTEVEIICDRVAFIKRGVVLEIAEVGRLVNGQVRVDIRASGVTPAILEGLERWGPDVRTSGGGLSLTLTDEAVLPEINRFLVEQGAAVYAIQPTRFSLEELFLRIIGTDGGL